MGNFKKIELDDNINLTLINTPKFKTNLVSVYIQRKLDKGEVTKNALLPSVIVSGSVKYPSIREISSQLDYFYGASLASEVVKKSEKQILEFKLYGICDKFTEKGVFNKSIVFLNEIINNPLIVNGGFKEEYLNLEKTNLTDRIRAEINDKKEYAKNRCIESMCRGERYSINKYGYESDIKDISARVLYDHYQEIIKTSPIDIVVEGDYNENDVVSAIKENFKFKRENIISIPREEYKKDINNVNVVTEKLDIAQSKLVIGYRTNVDYMDVDKYYALMVGNSVFGGGTHSKLFNNVREKESLCYYVYSTVEKYKGIMFVYSGIESKNYDKTLEIIKIQLEDLKNGKISNEELADSKSELVNSAKSIKDSIGGMSEFVFSQSVARTNNSLEELVENIKKVTVKDIVDAYEYLQLDTVYFLRD